MIFRFLTILFSSFLFIACSNRSNDDDIASGSQEVSIAHLKSLCKGDHYRIVNDYTVRGVVVATDWLGELNKSAIIVDESGGLEFAIDSRDISEHLPIYSEVTILCDGMMLARIGGKIELGAVPTGDFPLDNIDDEMFDRYIRVVGVCEDFAPTTKRISEISVADISTIIRFDNLRLCSEEQGLKWCDAVDGKPITTYRTFVDSEGNTLDIRTLSSCSYALEEIPQNEITVIGVIDFSDNRYFLRIVNKWII
jgi:hypothetical protein